MNSLTRRFSTGDFGRLILLLWLAAQSVLPTIAQHHHINAGATSSKEGAPLYFSNGTTWNADSGFLIRLTPTDTAAYGAIYKGGSDVTFTSLPRTADNGGPDPRAALPGAHLEMVLVSVDGPPGGAFSFWDSFDGFFDATEITVTLPTGTRGGTHRFALSENDGSPGADPYGHIHGRKFSVNLPGLYTVGCRLIDTGGNGLQGGPLHAASDLVYFNFQAGTTMGRITPAEGSVNLQFGTEGGKNYFVETAESLVSPVVWKTIAGPVAGTDRLESLAFVVPGAARLFYRLRVE